ncbi:MAG: zinc transporter ZupT [Crocinitomicaceae bacterium]|nr:zinc transporter ZupT [Crocinitomicaceae bacterium]|tara:strand:+ start:9126 stop:9926 length:801 start_codon:yes stop_codon:yes gene_type:complete
MEDNITLAFLLTTLAGLSTAIGAGIAFFAKKTNYKLLSTAMGFSAGVMIYISFVELFAEGYDSVAAHVGEDAGAWYITGAFFAGILVTALIDKLVPSFENPHEFDKGDEPPAEEAQYKHLYRMGIFTALVIGIHNFPEGIATFMGTLKDPQLGISIAMAVAIHNIPEGIAVSAPIFYATGNKKKAFWFSFASGLAEPVGAAVGFLILRPFLNEVVIGLSFAFIAGIMIFISFDQLLPAAQKYGSHHRSLYGLIAGMAVMAISLILS